MSILKMHQFLVANLLANHNKLYFYKIFYFSLEIDNRLR